MGGVEGKWGRGDGGERREGAGKRESRVNSASGGTASEVRRVSQTPASGPASGVATLSKTGPGSRSVRRPPPTTTTMTTNISLSLSFLFSVQPVQSWSLAYGVPTGVR